MVKEYEMKPLDGESGKIYVGIPRERIYIPFFVDNRDVILGHLREQGRGTGYFQAEGHRVDRNRDSIVEEFLGQENKPEWLCMLDSDMEHPTSAPIRLAKWSKPITGGLYFHRGQTSDPFVFKESRDKEDKWGRTIRQWRPMRDEVYKFLQDHSVPMRDGALTIDDCHYTPLVECDAVATGCLIIHRSVLETMEPPWFEYRPLGTSEDLQFCWEAKHDYGIPIHADLSTICGHYQWVAKGQAQFRILYKSRGLNLTNYSRKEAAEMLSEFLEVPFDDALERIEKGNAHMVGDYWNSKFSKKPPTPNQLKKFYEDDYTGRLYLIELLHWNFTQAFFNLRSILMETRDKKVLEIGGGIGTTSIQLCIQNNEVVTSEINPLLRDFIKYRYNEMLDELTTSVAPLYIVDHEEWKKADNASFDIVVAFDTFEHMDDATLKETLEHVSRVLKPGGSLVYHNNWEQQDLYPMHYNHSEMWDTWLLENGITPISTVEAVKNK